MTLHAQGLHHQVYLGAAGQRRKPASLAEMAKEASINLLLDVVLQEV